MRSVHTWRLTSILTCIRGLFVRYWGQITPHVPFNISKSLRTVIRSIYWYDLQTKASSFRNVIAFYYQVESIMCSQSRIDLFRSFYCIMFGQNGRLIYNPTTTWIKTYIMLTHIVLNDWLPRLCNYFSRKGVFVVIVYRSLCGKAFYLQNKYFSR